MMSLQISDLVPLKRFGVDADYQTDTLRFYSPWDDAHPVIMAVLGEVSTSLILSMFGLTDVEAATRVNVALDDKNVFTQITLDSTQYGGKTEHELLAQFKWEQEGNSVAIGRSEKGEIVHRKMMIVNGVWLVTGSTNWSLNGEQRQDNELSVTHNAVACAEARHVLDLSHTKALQDMAKRRQVPTAPVIV
jgi:phosphatidylserine/phosphatidylglycerophosphate/cardiolipin synthase-like enzyme